MPRTSSPLGLKNSKEKTKCSGNDIEASDSRSSIQSHSQSGLSAKPRLKHPDIPSLLADTIGWKCCTCGLSNAAQYALTLLSPQTHGTEECLGLIERECRQDPNGSLLLGDPHTRCTKCTFITNAYSCDGTLVDLGLARAEDATHRTKQLVTESDAESDSNPEEKVD